jgi:hypothetical protein
MSLFPDERGLGEFLSNLPGNEVGTTDWVSGRLVGPPQATAAYTVEQFVEMGMVGIYEQPEEASDAVSSERIKSKG